MHIYKYRMFRSHSDLKKWLDMNPQINLVSVAVWESKEEDADRPFPQVVAWYWERPEWMHPSFTSDEVSAPYPSLEETH